MKKDITIHPEATIRQAIEAMGKTSEKVLAVVNDEQILVGALSDGDIRRYILGGGDLSGTIGGVYKRDPVFVLQKNYDSKKIRKLLNNQLFHVTQQIDKVKDNGASIGVYPISEQAWIDIDQWAEYRQALQVFDN